MYVTACERHAVLTSKQLFEKISACIGKAKRQRQRLRIDSCGLHRNGAAKRLYIQTHAKLLHAVEEWGLLFTPRMNRTALLKWSEWAFSRYPKIFDIRVENVISFDFRKLEEYK